MAKVDAEALALQALARALADPAPKVLLGTAKKPGLFIGATQANKLAAQLCLERGWLEATGEWQGKGKTAKETYRLTPAGARQAVDKSEPVVLLTAATQQTTAALTQLADWSGKMEAALAGLDKQREILASLLDRLRPPELNKLTQARPPVPAVGADGWLDAAFAFLGDYQRAHPFGMCPLPELFAQIARPRGLSIGQFHDGLRQLVDQGRIRLHPFTGAAYTLEDEQYALVAGQEIKFYAQRIDDA